MSIFLTFIILVLLVVISFQDIKNRQISIFLFPSIFILGILGAWYAESINFQVMFNILYCLGMVAILFSYLGYKYKLSINDFFDQFFGIGDLLFWLAVTPFFQFDSYILLLTFSFLFAFFLHLILPLKNKHIPLAGFQAIFFLIYFGWVTFINNNSIFSFNIDWLNNFSKWTI